jgi:osmoprotectant transport system ATP-binding protein
MSDGRNGNADTMIRLEKLSKTFPGSDEPAVEELSMEIYEGEIVVFVGPSGCGKTTTMKMINRIIEPSSGKIFIKGEDVTKANPDTLRRNIGYVIQQIGLFPHMTIADNVATVRYPAELSGGQQQRVGVARAMAADPPIMLMDEPFGAVDPITRERLQDEFLRIQEDIRKTIIFVTHDIDEAIKMGDRIAILQEKSVIAQYDTPERILTDPASEFVEDFIGSGASLKRLSLSKVGDIEPANWPVASLEDSHDEARRKMRESGKDHVLLLDGQKKPKRWVSMADIEQNGVPLKEAGWPAIAIVEEKSSLYNTLDTMITSYKGSAIVVDDEGRYQGVVDFETVLAAIEDMRPQDVNRPDKPQRDVLR